MIKTLMANPMDFAQRHWPVIGLLSLLVLVLALAAFAAWPRTTATSAAATPAPNWSRTCVAGVSYLQFASGASVEWTPGGRVKTCSETATK
jgi:hypothetical protein